MVYANIASSSRADNGDHGDVLTGLDTVLECFLTVAQDLLQGLRVLLDVQAVVHHLLQLVRVVEVKDLKVNKGQQVRAIKIIR